MTRSLLLAACAGLLQAASLAWPFEGFSPLLASGQPSGLLQWGSLAMFAWVLSREHTPVRAGVLAWVFATAWFGGTFWWLFISMHRYGGLGVPMSVAGVVALAGLVALYYALAAAWLARTGMWGWRWALGFAAVWTLAELMRGQWLTGFPWGAGGYAQVDSVLAAWAPWVGVYGIGFVSALLAASVVADARKTAVATATACVACLIWAHSPYGQWGEPAGKLGVTLLQGNIAQDEKFQRGRGVEESLSWYAREISQSPDGLVVAPETAIPLLPKELPEGYLQAIAASVRPGQALLSGMPLGDLHQGYSNSAFGMVRAKPGASVQTYRYDKHHLVPFGEFIPPFFRWFTDMMNIPLGDFRRGETNQPSFAALGQRLAPNICYEDLFGEELAQRFVDTAKAPTVMVNLSNIGWFGDSTALDQHLHISRMRSLEFQRPMVRATNTGMSALINHRGQVVHVLPKLQQLQSGGELQGRKGQVTPYALWAGRWGLIPLWLMCFVCLGAAVVSHKRVCRVRPDV